MDRFSKARLRTRTGCFQCRQRRKKCDEHRPYCGGCRRNHLDCSWPTASTQPADGRRRRQTSSPALSCSIVRSLPFQQHSNEDYYHHFARSVMPRLVRQNCLSKYTDQSHMLRLGLEFPPLMGVMVAIAALDRENQRQLAMQSYLSSIRELRGRIAEARDAGNQDALLATTVCLCVYESFRSDAPPLVAPHATAAGIILSSRYPTKSGRQAVQAFERICAESFIYHSALMMLFDPSFDALGNPICRVDLERFLTDPIQNGVVLPTSTQQPVLDTSYQFFLLIADVTRIARLPQPLSHTPHILTWQRLQDELDRWEENSQTENEGIVLTILAMRILLLKVDPYLSFEDAEEHIHRLLRRGVELVRSVDTQRFLISYLLWPLAVLGCVASNQDDQRVLDEKIFLLVRRRGQAVWVSSHVENIRAKSPLLKERLRSLVGVGNETTSSLYLTA